MSTLPALTDDELIALARELTTAPRLGLSFEEVSIAESAQDQAVPDGHSNPLWEIVRLLPGTKTFFRSHRIEPDGHWASGSDIAAMKRAYAAGLDRHSLCARYSWSIPSPGDIAWLAQMLDGRGVVEIGEGPGGCCADDRFHSILERDFEEVGASPFHVTYWGIHCSLTVHRRRVKAIEA